ncbi:hypothetical protein TNCV_4318361 [Trichonephila clavipes]|nr:hypothetical protein TNCV_4318361 [Trichonephila clavipes]
MFIKHPRELSSSGRFKNWQSGFSLRLTTLDIWHLLTYQTHTHNLTIKFKCAINAKTRRRKDAFQEKEKVKSYVYKGHHLDAFTHGRRIDKLREKCNLTSVTKEFGTDKSAVEKTTQMTVTVVRKVGGDPSSTTTKSDDRYIVLPAKRD